MKPKGMQHIHVNLKINISILTGETQLYADKVPAQFLYYTPDKEDKTKEKYKLWVHLESTRLNEYLQKNKELKEISIWFEDEAIDKIKLLLNSNLSKKLEEWM